MVLISLSFIFTKRKRAYTKLTAAKIQYPMMIAVAAGESDFYTKAAVNDTKTVISAIVLNTFSFI